MKIYVVAKPKAFKNQILKIDNNHFKVCVTAPPVKGMANKAIVDELANYFEIAQSKIKLISGFSSKQKIFEILD